MARTTPYYTTTDLLASIKRKISLPTSQNTFSDSDIIDFINEEMEISMVPSVLEYHEEHFVYTETRPLLDNTRRYGIPKRAIGMRVRDVFWKDSNGNLFEMTLVSPDDKAFFQSGLGGNESIHKFYFENNDIVLTPLIVTSPTGSLEISYFRRPNLLTTNDRAAISTAITKTITVVNASLVSGDTVKVGSITLVADTDFTIGANSVATATNLVSAISALSGFTASNDGSSSATVTVEFSTVDTAFDSDTDGLVLQSGIGIKCSSVPANITNNSVVDILQTEGGHKSLNIDITLSGDSIQGDIINFNEGEVPSNFIVGDYICSRFESIIPQIPDDLHSSLADRVCSSILRSIADYEGLKAQDSRIVNNMRREGNLIDNRAEGAPKKINGRNSLIRYSKSRYRRKV